MAPVVALLLSLCSQRKFPTFTGLHSKLGKNMAGQKDLRLSSSCPAIFLPLAEQQRGQITLQSTCRLTGTFPFWKVLDLQIVEVIYCETGSC